MRAVTRNRRRIAAVAVASSLCVAAGAGLVRAGGPDPATGLDARRPASTASVPPLVAAVGVGAVPSENGAVRTAVDVIGLAQDWLYLPDEEVRARVLEVATPGAGPALADVTVAEVSAVRADLGLSPGPVWWVVHPLATRVVAYTPEAAEVEVWAVTVLAAVEVAAPQAAWLTVTVDLAWAGEGWLVESIRDRPGPSPMLGPRDLAWDAAPFTDALEGFARLEGGPLDEAAS